MSLSSLYLDAFAEVARQKSFSRAAEKLFITQSALSQRVLNLEKELGSTLFIRESSGLRLTDLGQSLLRYCQSKETLEAEFVGRIHSSEGLAGRIRIGTFSTLTRSVLLPLLAGLGRKHQNLQYEIRSEEMRNLPPLLTSGAVDFIFLTHPLEKQGVINQTVGFEENVLIQGTAKGTKEDIYLDHDAEDNTTREFFKAQAKKVPDYKRDYLDEIYAIIEAVNLGMGRAVVPRHLIKGIKGVKILNRYKSLHVPVYLVYYEQSFYSELQKAVINILTQEVPKALSRPS